MKLRKHLRNLRLENITQLGNLDRVVDLRFGSGEYAHHVLLELYGLGNLILTDGKYGILALLRLHEYSKVGGGTGEGDEGGGDVKVRVGNVYPVTYATTISTAGNPALDGTTPQSLLEMNQEEAYQWTKQELTVLKAKAGEQQSQLQNQSKKKQGKKNKNNGSSTLKMLLLKPASGVFHYGPSLLEHCILSANLDPTLKFTLETYDSILPPTTWGILLEKLKQEGDNILQNFHRGDGKGYILYRLKPSTTPTSPTSITTTTTSTTITAQPSKIPHSNKIFEEFQPHLLAQHTNRLHITLPTFSSAIDTFYSLLSGQRRALRAEQTEQSARDRLLKIRADQSQRMLDLEQSMSSLKEHAALVALHADDVEKALGVINGAVGVGMDWEALDELVGVEKANGNPIAMLIGSLDLEGGKMVVCLPDTRGWEEGNEEDGAGGEDLLPPIVDIVISLGDSAHGNARSMYDRYRSSRVKADKTLQASQKALAAAEANAEKQIEAARKNKSMSYSIMMQPQRKQHWFEKFHWFVTSDNYLVLGGRDAQQNEILVKRYLRPGDAYLHADVHGAPSCILRAKRRRTATKGSTEVLPLSNQALQEAGNFGICRSAAWASRMVTSAWWVQSHQVSKTAPTGEYLTVGSFMIRGKKNFLPASQLEMGLGVMFRLGDEASVARHVNERRDFTLMVLEEDCDGVGGSGDDDGEGWEKKQDVSCPNTVEDSNDGHKNGCTNDGAPNEVRVANTIETILNTGSYRDNEEEKKDVNEPVPACNAPCENRRQSTNISNEKNDAKEGVVDLGSAITKKKKKGLSARDRKLIKRYGSLDAAEEILEKLKVEEKQQKTTSTKSLPSSDEPIENKSEPKGKQSNVRGRKSKMKKIAKKYADQDDEDRELAAIALQGGEKMTKKKNKKKGGRLNANVESLNQLKAAAETTSLLIKNAEDVVDSKLSQEVRTILAVCVTVKASGGSAIEGSKIIRWDKLDAEVLEQLVKLDSIEAQVAAANRLLSLTQSTRVDNFSASLAGIIRTVQKYGYEGIQPIDNEGAGVEGKQRKTRAEKAAEKEAWREILAEDGIIEDDGDNDGGPVDDTAEIGKLTGKPNSDDLVLYALPVCAPYHTLRNYSYRVKLTPGSQRRGKASKQCIEMFKRTDDRSADRIAMSRYYDLIKGVNVNDWAQVICGDVKISAAGASKVMKKQKTGAKKSKKK